MKPEEFKKLRELKITFHEALINLRKLEIIVSLNIESMTAVEKELDEMIENLKGIKL